MSQAELAGQAEVTTNYVSRLEGGGVHAQAVDDRLRGAVG
jgi:hypothetical protein